MPFFGKSGTPRMSCLNLSIPKPHDTRITLERAKRAPARKSGHIIAARVDKRQTKSWFYNLDSVAGVFQAHQSAILGTLWISERIALEVLASTSSGNFERPTE